MSPNASPCARPYSSQREMSVTKIRVRTTSARPAPRRSRAAATLAIAWVVCAYGVALVHDLAAARPRCSPATNT